MRFYAPINFKPEGWGGRANNGNLIVKSVPRVEFSILSDVPRVGNLIIRDRGLKAI